MRVFKRWLIDRFYPAVAKEEIARLRQKLQERNAEIDRLNAYIDGLEDGRRALSRIVINNSGGAK